MQIDCPWCGAREYEEFRYGGDAMVTRPADPTHASADAWYAYIYLRDNPRGAHAEWWYHAYGCHQWLRVSRDTVTHNVLAVAPAHADPHEEGP
jgi:sarcosine oxidase subunit delta